MAYEYHLIWTPDLVENIRSCLEYLKAVFRHPEICPVRNDYYQENWTERRKEFLWEVSSKLDEFSKEFLKSPGIFWVFTDNDLIPIHRVQLANEEEKLFQWPEGKDYYDGYLIIASPDEEKKVGLMDLRDWVIYKIEDLLLSKPRLPGSDDYTDRDYDSAMRNLINQITLVDPDLGKLIAAPGTMDSLICDMMAYLYDRLQAYLDFYASGALTGEARGEYLEKLAKYLGYEPVPPIPAVFPVKIKLSEHFLSVLNKKITEDKIPLIIGKGSSTLIIFLHWVNPEDLPKKIDLGGKFFYLGKDISELRFVLSSSREFPVFGSDCILTYYEGTEVEETFFVDLSRYTEIVLSKEPVDLGSIHIELENVPGPIPDLEAKIISSPKDLLKYTVIRIEEGIPVSARQVLFLLFYDRDGRVKLVPLPPGSGTDSGVSRFNMKVKYRIHSGAEGNGKRLKKSVSVPLRLVDNRIIIEGVDGKESYWVLDGWNMNYPFAYLILDSLDFSSGGYDGDSDQDIRDIISGYLRNENVRSSAIMQYSRRAVIEEDFDLILKSYPKAKIFKTLVSVYAKPLKVVDYTTTKEAEKEV